MEILLYCKHFHITIQMYPFDPPPRFNYGAMRDAIRRLALMELRATEEILSEEEEEELKKGAARFTALCNNVPNATTFQKFCDEMKAVARERDDRMGQKLALFSMMREVLTLTVQKRNDNDTKRYAKYIGESTFLWLHEEEDGLSLEDWKKWIEEVLRQPLYVLQTVPTNEDVRDWPFFTLSLSIQIVADKFKNDPHEGDVLREWIFQMIRRNAKKIYQLAHRTYGLCECLSDERQSDVAKIVAEIKPSLPKKAQNNLWEKKSGR